jgi:Arc/MetJ-type ribon-helix-helix transcriptional regulator
MAISLTAETQRRIEERMRTGGFASADVLVGAALDTLEQQGEAIEDLDPATQAAIARAEAQAARGEGRPWAEVKRELRAGMAV